MSPAEILAVPGAWKYWSTIEDVERYIKEMEKQKARSGGKDFMDALADYERAKQNGSVYFIQIFISAYTITGRKSRSSDVAACSEINHDRD